MAETETPVLDAPETAQEELTPADEQDTNADALVADTDGASEEGDTDTLLTPEQAEELAEQKLAAFKAEQHEEQTAQNYRAALQRSSQVLSTDASQRLNGVINFVLSRVEAGDDPDLIRRNISQQAVNEIAFWLGDAAFVSQMDLIAENNRSFVAKAVPDFKPSPELVKELERAHRALPGDQPGTQALRRTTAEWNYFLEAAKHAAKAELVAEQEANDKKAVTTKGLAKPATNGQRPISGAGGSTPGSMTLAQIEAMPTAQWLAMPKERRDKILADAHARNR